jgi:hypothetical protein
MALCGSLAEIKVCDLLQLLRASGGSGELVLAGVDADARLFFSAGRLVGATSRQREGVDLLTTVLGWSEGEFEFRRADDVPHNGDGRLDEAFLGMVAVVNCGSGETNGTVSGQYPMASLALDDPRASKLVQFVQSHPFVEHACLLDPSGSIRAQSATNILPINQVRTLAAAVINLCISHPRPDLRRLIIEDDQGVVVFARLSDGTGLMLVADGRTPVGAVSTAVSRLVGSLEVHQ